MTPSIYTHRREFDRLAFVVESDAGKTIAIERVLVRVEKTNRRLVALEPPSPKPSIPFNIRIKTSTTKRAVPVRRLLRYRRYACDPCLRSLNERRTRLRSRIPLSSPKHLLLHLCPKDLALVSPTLRLSTRRYAAVERRNDTGTQFDGIVDSKRESTIDYADSFDRIVDERRRRCDRVPTKRGAFLRLIGS